MSTRENVPPPWEAERQIIHPKAEIAEMEEGHHLDEFKVALTPFEDMVEFFGANPSDGEIEKCVNAFLGGYKKYFKYNSTKEQISGYLRTLIEEERGDGSAKAVNRLRFLTKAEQAVQRSI